MVIAELHLASHSNPELEVTNLLLCSDLILIGSRVAQSYDCGSMRDPANVEPLGVHPQL